jgi:hypothetical protein
VLLCSVVWLKKHRHPTPYINAHKGKTVWWSREDFLDFSIDAQAKTVKVKGKWVQLQQSCPCSTG